MSDYCFCDLCMGRLDPPDDFDTDYLADLADTRSADDGDALRKGE